VILRQLLYSTLVLVFTVPCFAQQSATETDKQLTADVLKKTLFTRTADEEKFCDALIQKRDAGIVPSRIIYGVYRKALEKDRGLRFAYFKTGIEILCKREGIELNPAPVKKPPTVPAITFPSFKRFFQ
jgi:hypothetical protein